MYRNLEALLIALVFATCHLVSPRVFRLREQYRRAASSFSGGLAAAYICLHLIPEIEEGHELLGSRIYFLVLVGLSVFYGLEVWIERHGGQKQQANLHLIILGIYTTSISFTLSLQLPESLLLSLTYAVAMGLHLMSCDFSLLELQPRRFIHLGRFALVGATVVGYATSFVRTPHPAAMDAVTALLAGFMLFTIFRREIPDFREAHFRAFLIGAGSFLFMHLLVDPDLHALLF